MTRTSLYVIIAALVAVGIGLSIYAYQQTQKPALEIRVDEGGISIEGNG